jgi:acetolactate synthase I/II/III large subunit
MSGEMNGAQTLAQTLVNCGVDVCFANPGTSEMHFVAALDAVEGIRPVLCLFDESTTSGLSLLMALACSRPHTQLPLAGGSIGQGLPLAVGAALAAPDRKVICPHGDGGAAYTMQALNLDVTTVIYANRSYAILNIELQRVGVGAVGPRALSMLDLHNPEMNWAKIASGLGVEASRASSAEEFASQFGSAMKHRGPRLIEAMI